MRKIVILCLLFSVSASASPQRCDTADGRVIYTDEECPKGSRVRQVEQAPLPSAEETGRAAAESALVQWRGNLAGERAAQRIEADAERARLQRQYEQAAAERAEQLAVQRRQAAALEQIAEDQRARPTFICQRCRPSDWRCR